MQQKSQSNPNRFGTLILALFTLFSGVGSSQASETLAQEIVTPALAGSRQQHLAATSDGRLLLSWVEGGEPEARLRFAVLAAERWSEPHTLTTVQGSFAAAPVVLELSDGALAAAWMTHTDRTQNKYAAAIHLSRSTDGGRSWTALVTPYPKEALIYDAQMSLAALDQGRIALVWTDQRRAKTDHLYQHMAVVIDQDGKPGFEMVVDGDVCSCCETGMAAQGEDWLLAYRDRLEGEIRDTALARWSTGKITTRRLSNENWVIAGCPSNGPSVSWRKSQVLVAWFTAADGVGRVKAAFSKDNGETFGPPLEVEPNASGYVATLLLEDGSALIAWRGRVGPKDELRVARVRPDGISESRTALYLGEFPRWPSRHLRLTQAGSDVYVAWTDPSVPKVRLVRLPSLMTASKAP